MKKEFEFIQIRVVVTWCLLSLLATIAFAGDGNVAALENSDFHGLDVYLIRHAQTMANVTKKYTPENQQSFSELGTEQVASVADKLAPYEFDAILVSPVWRARRTILPYLKANDLHAEIWPELNECCWQKNRKAPATENLPQGDRVVLDEDDLPYFAFRDPTAPFLCAPKNYADGLVQVRTAHDLFLKEFRGSGKTILLVSHYHSGGRIMQLLLGQEPKGGFWLSNAKLWHLREQPDGTFKLLMMNDKVLDK